MVDVSRNHPFEMSLFHSMKDKYSQYFCDDKYL